MAQSNILYLDDYREHEPSSWIWLPVGAIAMLVLFAGLTAPAWLLFFASSFLPAN